MATKRKLELDATPLTLPSSSRLEEVTRSGRVRKKPAKFVEDEEEDADITPEVVKVPKPSVPLVTLPAPVAKVVAMPTKMKYDTPVIVKEESSSTDEESAKAAANRISRARKKSAKVLEMEEFEEAEKKHVNKKDIGKKNKSYPGSSLQISPVDSPIMHGSSLANLSIPAPIPVLKIKDIPSGPKVETVLSSNVQLSPQRSPKAESQKSPIASTNSSDGKASVIKLLLSSPTAGSKPVISSNTVSQLTHNEDNQIPHPKKPKLKAAPPLEASSSIRKALEMAPPFSVHIKAPVSPAKKRIETGQPLSVKSEKDKRDTTLEFSAMPVTPAAKEVKAKKIAKKSEKSALKNDNPFLPPAIPSPNVIHVGSMIGLEVKQEIDKKGKRKGKIEKKDKLDMGAEMTRADFELDMPGITLDGDESFIEIDDEDSLLIHEEEVETERPKSKGGKKKLGKAKGKVDSVQLGDIPSVAEGELVMDLMRSKSDEKKRKKIPKEPKDESLENQLSKKKRAPTAYMLWCNSNRHKVVNDNPGIDFSTISKTLGEMWSNLSDKEKMMWKRKAKKATRKGSTLITTGKTGVSKVAPNGVAAKPNVALVQKSNPALTQVLLSNKQIKPASLDDLGVPVKGFGIEPVDVAAHLKIVGESLSIIGMKLQEHRGLIAVQGSLSVLLDSMLCALAPLMCLTAVLPETNGLPAETHMKNLDNIAYIMPGL